MSISPALVRELLTYDKDTGVFIWKRRSENHFVSKRGHAIWNARYAGTKAGTVVTNKRGYKFVSITIKYQRVRAHHLAFAYMGLSIPDEIDHKDRDGTNNQWENLRAVSRQQNTMNRTIQSNNTSGFVGVSKRKDSGRWSAYVKIHGKKKTLGTFDTAEEAAEVSKIARKQLGFSPGHGAAKPLS